MVVLNPKRLHKNHFLTKAVHESARSFDIGEGKKRIELSAELPVGVAAQLPLNPAAARRLGRSTNVVEAVAAGIESAKTVTQLRDHLALMQVPEDLVQASQFFLVSARRREPGTPIRARTRINVVDKGVSEPRSEHGIIGLQAEMPIRASRSFILAFAHARGKVHALVIDEVTGIVVSIYKPGLLSAFQEAADETTDDLEDETTVNTSDAHKDFAECYSNCIDNLPPYLLELAGGVCGACVITVGVAAAAPTKVTVGVFIAVCSFCAAVLGVIFANCLLTCHEMLET